MMISTSLGSAAITVDVPADLVQWLRLSADLALESVSGPSSTRNGNVSWTRP